MRERFVKRLPQLLGALALLLFTLILNGVSPLHIALVFAAVLAVLPMVLVVRRLFGPRPAAQVAWRWIWTHPTPGSIIFPGFVMLLGFLVGLFQMSVTVDAVITGGIWIVCSLWLRLKWNSFVRPAVVASGIDRGIPDQPS